MTSVPSCCMKKGGFLNHVMADINYEICRLKGSVDVVMRGQRCTTHEQRMVFVNNTFAELGRNEGDAGLIDENR